MWGAIAAALTFANTGVASAVASGGAPAWVAWVNIALGAGAAGAGWMAKSPRDEVAARRGKAAGEAAEAASRSTERPEHE